MRKLAKIILCALNKTYSQRICFWEKSQPKPSTKPYAVIKESELSIYVFVLNVW